MPSNFFFRRSLTTRMTLFIVAVFLIGLWSLALYTSRMLRTDMQDLLGEQQFSAVSLVTETVDQEFEHRFQALETVAKDISPALMTQPAALQAMLEKRPVFQDEFNGGTFVTGLDGIAVASTPVSVGRLGVNYIDRDFILAALKRGKATVGRPVLGKKMQVPIFVMAVPIRNAQGQVTGVFAGVTDLSLPNFLDKITEGHYGLTGGYLVISPRHRLVVTSTGKGRVMETLPAPGLNPLIDRFLAGYEGTTVLVNPLGVEVLASSKHVEQADWNLVALLPTTEAFAPVAAMQQRLLWVTLMFSLLAAGLVSWVGTRMIKRQLLPMLVVTRTLTTLPEGSQLPRALPVTSQDEIGELVGGFNHLLDRLAEREEEVRQLAFYDPLTKLSNRRLLNDRLGQALVACQRNASRGALIFLDLDNFKPLNDQHGHDIGDLLLIEAAARLKNCVREVDTVARFGGDEFVVLLADLDPDLASATVQSGTIAEKIRQALSQPYALSLTRADDSELSVTHCCTASIGVALFGPKDNRQADLLKYADVAMYQAKAAGRNVVCFHAPGAAAPG